MTLLLEIENLPIRVNTRGQWLHGDEPLHKKVEALFQKSVRLNSDGSYRIEVGRNSSPIEVADVAFFVKSIEITIDENQKIDNVRLWLSDGAIEDLNPTTLMQSKSNVFYCKIQRDGFFVPCRFSPAAYHELLLYGELQDEEVVLGIQGREYRIGDYTPFPEAINLPLS
tara:strand:+ start:328 stop:834 length:507 start_codon:yes stop_codon:yes gene_type:complete